MDSQELRGYLQGLMNMQQAIIQRLDTLVTLFEEEEGAMTEEDDKRTNIGEKE